MDCSHPTALAARIALLLAISVCAVLAPALAAPDVGSFSVHRAQSTTQPTSRASEQQRGDAHREQPNYAQSPRQVSDIHPIRGFALNVHHIGDLSLYLRSVDEVADLGANSLIVVTPWFQREVDSNQMRRVDSKCPTRGQLLAIFERAHRRGMHTTLLPIVLIEDPGEKDWRGVIAPTSWSTWWRAYRRFALYFADFAAEAQIDLLSVGSELNSTEDDTVRWRDLIRTIRKRYDGELTYSANWDRYQHVRFWDELDVMSVSSYFELERDKPGAALDKLIDAWEPIRSRLTRFAWQWNKPLVLSEIGYPSLPWANAHPWNYVAPSGTEADHRMQARCWEAFFAAWRSTLLEAKSTVAGFYCYHWDPYHSGHATDTGYGVRGKPALEVIQDAFADLRENAAPNAERK